MKFGQPCRKVLAVLLMLACQAFASLDEMFQDNPSEQPCTDPMAFNLTDMADIWTAYNRLAACPPLFDPHFLFCLRTARDKLNRWKMMQPQNLNWLNVLPDCPNKIQKCGRKFCCPNKALKGVWTRPKIPHDWLDYHGGNPCMRSKQDFPCGQGQQCCYDKITLNLIKRPDRNAGTPDLAAPGNHGWDGHWNNDVRPVRWADEIGAGVRQMEYFPFRPPNNGGGVPC